MPRRLVTNPLYDEVNAIRHLNKLKSLFIQRDELLKAEQVEAVIHMLRFDVSALVLKRDPACWPGH